MHVRMPMRQVESEEKENAQNYGTHYSPFRLEKQQAREGKKENVEYISELREAKVRNESHVFAHSESREENALRAIIQRQGY